MFVALSTASQTTLGTFRVNERLKMNKFFQATEGAVMVMYTEAHTVQFTFVHTQMWNLKFAL